jgi:hypothetical protein
MYAGVPTAMPSVVTVCAAMGSDAASALATPKSVTRACPDWSSTFPGLTSRCTTPRTWAWPSAPTTSRRSRSTSRGVNAWPRAERAAASARSDSPSMNGIV